MEIKRLNADALSAPEILSLLEIARSFCAAKPDWPQLRRRLGAGEAWGFFDGASSTGHRWRALLWLTLRRPTLLMPPS